MIMILQMGVFSAQIVRYVVQFAVMRMIAHELSRNLAEKFKSISDIISSNKLRLNSDKTHLMHFSYNRPRIDNTQNDDVQLITGN